MLNIITAEKVAGFVEIHHDPFSRFVHFQVLGRLLQNAVRFPGDPGVIPQLAELPVDIETPVSDLPYAADGLGGLRVGDLFAEIVLGR